MRHSLCRPSSFPPACPSPSPRPATPLQVQTVIMSSRQQCSTGASQHSTVSTMSMYDADFRGTDLARHNSSTKGEKTPPGVKDPYSGGGDSTAADGTMGTGPGGTVTQGGKPDPEVSKQAERLTGEPSPDPYVFDRELNKANENPSLTEGASKMVENIKSAFKSD